MPILTIMDFLQAVRFKASRENAKSGIVIPPQSQTGED